VVDDAGPQNFGAPHIRDVGREPLRGIAFMDARITSNRGLPRHVGRKADVTSIVLGGEGGSIVQEGGTLETDGLDIVVVHAHPNEGFNGAANTTGCKVSRGSRGVGLEDHIAEEDGGVGASIEYFVDLEFAFEVVVELLGLLVLGVMQNAIQESVNYAVLQSATNVIVDTNRDTRVKGADDLIDSTSAGIIVVIICELICFENLQGVLLQSRGVIAGAAMDPFDLDIGLAVVTSFVDENHCSWSVMGSVPMRQ